MKDASIDELRGYIDQVRTERRALRIKDVEWQRGPGEVLALEVHVSPLLADEITIGVSVVFHDVTANRRLLSELSRANQQRESAYEELQSTNEELETTNEELQSTVEELETTNEELQSTNEELTTLNDEMAHRNEELSRLNADLNNLHASIDTPILLLARDLTIRRFTAQAEKLFNLLETDIGRPLGGVRHNIDFPGLEAMVREVVDTQRLWHVVVHNGDAPRYALITSFESGPTLEAWIAEQRQIVPSLR